MKKYEPMKIIKQDEKKDDSIFEKIKEYFEKTPIEEIRRGWEEAGEKTKNIKSPIIGEFNIYLRQNKSPISLIGFGGFFIFTYSNTDSFKPHILHESYNKWSEP